MGMKKRGWRTASAEVSEQSTCYEIMIFVLGLGDRCRSRDSRHHESLFSELVAFRWTPDSEIRAAVLRNLIGRVQARADREGLRERAQREFEPGRPQ